MDLFSKVKPTCLSESDMKISDLVEEIRLKLTVNLKDRERARAVTRHRLSPYHERISSRADCCKRSISGSRSPDCGSCQSNRKQYKSVPESHIFLMKLLQEQRLLQEAVRRLQEDRQPRPIDSHSYLDSKGSLDSHGSCKLLSRSSSYQTSDSECEFDL